jgi:predicted NUDIX family phosphoesterase
LHFDVDRYIKEFFNSGVPRFMIRSQAEKDPSFKQLIPYVIMNHDNKYLSYVRGKQAGEKRLVSKRSIGIGGHINPIDWTLFSVDAYKIYLEAVKREVAEEVSVNSAYTDKIVALLNDESNEVGSVHLGIVHYWMLSEPKVSKKEQMITQMSFMTPVELQEVKDTMETWSQLCLSGLEEMAERVKSA